MHSFDVKIDIHASKDEVWNLVFNKFGSVNDFNPIIEGSHHHNGTEGEVGCERVCEIDSKTKVIEKITDAKTGEYFSIAIVDGGLPMMDEMTASMHLKENRQGGTEVKIVANFSTKPRFVAHLMKATIKKMFFKMLIGLKYHLETTELVTKDNIKTIEKEYKRTGSNYRFSVAA